MVLSYYLVHYSTINFVIAELCWTELVHSNSVTWKFWRRSMSKCLEETLSGSYLFLIILTSENKWITSLFRLIFPTTIHFNTVLLGQPKSTLLNLINTSIIILALPRWSCRKHNTPYGWKPVKIAEMIVDMCIYLCSACYTEVKGDDLLGALWDDTELSPCASVLDLGVEASCFL